MLPVKKAAFSSCKCCLGYQPELIFCAGAVVVNALDESALLSCCDLLLVDEGGGTANAEDRRQLLQLAQKQGVTLKTIAWLTEVCCASSSLSSARVLHGEA